MEEGDPPEPDLTEIVYPYAKTAMLIFTAGRVVLMLITFKRLSVCRYYIYYELLLTIINAFLPRGWTYEVENHKMMMMAIFNFTIYYFEWWPSLIT